MNLQSNTRQRGFTLIELMVALLLGLLVVAAAGSIFLSNRRVYGSTEAVNRIQENQRAAFEMMARDIRQAGANPCTRFSTDPVSMRLTAPDAAFWGHFNGGIRGESGGSSDVVTVYSANDLQRQVVLHKAPGDPLVLNNASGIVAGQEVIACNNDAAIAFSVSGVSGNELAHEAGANCGGGMTAEVDSGKCGEAQAGPVFCFWGDTAAVPTAAEAALCQPGVGRSPAFLIVPTAIRWTVENNGRGGSSLYRSTATGKDEVAEGVTALNITYKVGTDSNYRAASAVDGANDWGRVTAVHLAMSFQAERGAMASGDVKGVDGGALVRNMSDVIVLRNHQEDIL